MSNKKVQRRRNIRYRIRKKIAGTAQRPRLSVFKSNKQIYAQLIDDVNGVTLASASSKESTVDSASKKVDVATQVGKILAERAKDNGFENVVFDRSGYVYHGRIKALADGAREAGLNF